MWRNSLHTCKCEQLFIQFKLVLLAEVWAFDCSIHHSSMCYFNQWEKRGEEGKCSEEEEEGGGVEEENNYKCSVRQNLDITIAFCFQFSCNLECSWRSHMHVKDPVVHVKSLVDYGNIKITQHALKGVRGLKLDAIKKRKKKQKEQCFRKQPSVKVGSGNHSRPLPVVPGAQQTAPWAVLRAAPPPPTLLPSVPTAAHGLHSGETALMPAPLLTLTAVEKK